MRPMAVVMVGLPGRGKSYTARKIAVYLRWRGYEASVFNVGQYRRERLGAGQSHEFFDPDNPTGHAARREMAALALEDMLGWLAGAGQVGIYDATNSTRSRRDWVRRRCEAAGVRVMFVEIVCTDPAVLETNIRQVKARSDDYAESGGDDAVDDFRRRIAHYESVYEPLNDDTVSFVRVTDVGLQVVANRMQGYLPSRIVYLLMNLHVVPRPIYLTRHGESRFNVEDRIGGDAALSPRGEEYASRLGEFAHTAFQGQPRVWASTLRRAMQTAHAITPDPEMWPALREIDAGRCDGMTYAEIARDMPEVHAARQLDKLRYRYPGGESYEDVVKRLEPVILELERQRLPLLVVSHQAVLRALIAYLRDRPREEAPYLNVPLHTVLKITPTAYGVDVVTEVLGP
jgi:broad specificity phosphatase PhoE/predicted kinase